VAPRPFDGVKETSQGLVLTLPPHSFVTLQAPVARAH
jgi:alpha-N-arabinofuranosidase